MPDSAISSRRSNILATALSETAAGDAAYVYQLVSTWYRIRRDERFLLGQPDHVLRDIGIARSEIARALRNGMRP